DLDEMVGPLEETFGEKGFFKNSAEAIDFYTGALEEIGKFCAKEVRPSAAEIDRTGCKFDTGNVILPEKLTDHLRACRDLGMFSASVARKYGGMNLPRSVQ